jgi:putative endonuclease
MQAEGLNPYSLKTKNKMKTAAYVYFMANQNNNVLYTGITKNITRRVAEHKAKVHKGFTCRYNCEKLVYYEMYNLVTDAITREKQLKNWQRKWKNHLVNEENPEWRDLSEEVGVDDELVNEVKRYYHEIAVQARNEDS